jgi:DNA-binding transcriptional regulator YhcF (GntR family)
VRVVLDEHTTHQLLGALTMVILVDPDKKKEKEEKGDEILSMREAADLLGVEITTMHTIVKRTVRNIPIFTREGRNIYLLKSDVLRALQDGQWKLSASELTEAQKKSSRKRRRTRTIVKKIITQVEREDGTSFVILLISSLIFLVLVGYVIFELK